MSGGSILWGINLVYFLAFGSLYIQLPGLIGDDGVAPVRLLDLSSPKTLEDFVLGIPSVIRFRESFNLSAYHAAELLVLIGLSLSFFALAAPQLRGTLSLIIQWISFFSVVKICPSYANWRFTSILVETGFLCILLSIKLRRSPNSPASGIAIWLMRWLLFREAVITGYTKLTRSSYSWWDLSAMEHYFTNQPLPAPLAWFVETNPTWILRLFTATIVVFDVFVSFLFLVPIRQLQIFSFVFKFLMHANMMVSGNYGTYNILSIVLSFALLPPPPPPPSKKRKRDSFTCRKAASWAVTLAVLAVMCYGVWTVFGLHDGLKSLRIVIPRHAFVAYARRVMFYTIPISTLLFIFTIITAAFRALGARGCMNKMLDLSGVLLVSLLGIGLFVASLPPLSNLEDTGSVVLLPRSVHEISAALKPLHLANDYRYYHEHDSNVLMKTPAEGRSTLVLEGAMNENGPWKELSFYHVPDRLEKIPTIIPGHLPVVDLEVVLSGDKSFENSPILAILVYRILTKQKEVLQLIEPTGFIDGPKYIRIKKYTYQLTKSMSGKEWWQRRLQNIHLPPTHASTPRLTQLMDKLGITGKRRERPADATVISTSLDKIRAMVGQPHNLNGFYVVLVIVLLMNKLF